MKKLITTCCIAAGLLMPMTMNTTLSAAPFTHERHPEIVDALHSLQNAREHLEHAAHDFGGHRKAALVAIDNAIAQLKVAMQYDRR